MNCSAVDATFRGLGVTNRDYELYVVAWEVVLFEINEFILSDIKYPHWFTKLFPIIILLFGEEMNTFWTLYWRNVGFEFHSYQ